MSDLTTQTPLMLPIHYDGQVYFTSHYFHQQYRANKPDGGKYAKLQHFNRLIRGIESYSLYLDRSDIVELTKDEAGPEFGPVFKATYGKPIMLINATAQVALTHHLDDEISKQVSVNVNEQAVKTVVKSSIQPSKEFKALYGIARLIGMDKNAAAISANQGVRKITGANILELIDSTHLKADNQDSLAYTPSELGLRIGVSGQKFNKMLESAGLQTKVGDHWAPTPKARGLCVVLDTGKKHGDGTPIQQVKWYECVLDVLEKEEGAVS